MITDTDMLSLISATLEQINETESFQDVAGLIFDFIKAYTSYNMAVIYRLPESADSLEVVACLGTDLDKLRKRVRFKIGEGAVGRVAKEKKPLYFRNVEKEQPMLVRQFCGEDPLIRSFMAVPLIARGRVNGILSLSSSQEGVYGEKDVKMLSAIASQSAVLLEMNDRLSFESSTSETLLANINSGVVMVDSCNRIVMLNSAAETISGYSLHDVLHQPVDCLKLQLQYNGASSDFDVSSPVLNEADGLLISKTGESIELKVSTSSVYRKKDDVQYAICIFRDNREINELSRQLELAEKMAVLGNFTAEITHEVRNSLLPIRNASEYLLRKYGQQGKEIDTMLRIILEESNRLNKLISQMSALYRSDSFERGTCDAVEVIDSVLQLLAYSLEKHGITVEKQFSEENIPISISRDSMKQVIINIIANAIEATKENSICNDNRITIKISTNGTTVGIYIKDSGIGIQPEVLKKVFQPLFTTKSNGMGIGLPMVKNIVEKANGQIRISSEYTQGTLVSVFLPGANYE